MPRHLKFYIVGKLDPKSRRSLALCSKSDYETTQNVPFHIRTVCFGIDLDHLESIKCIFHAESNRNHMFVPRFLPQDTAITSFLSLVKNSKSEIRTLYFSMVPELDVFCSELISEISSKKCKPRIKKLFFTNKFANFDIVLKLIKLVDPKMLEFLEIEANISDDFLEKLVETDQWKSLKSASICVGNCENMNLGHFLHLNQLKLGGFKSLNEDNRAMMIEIFKNRDPPANSFFFISTETKNRYMAIDTTQRQIKINMAGSGKKLHVEELENVIQGRVIGDADGENVPFRKLLIQMYN